MAKILCIEDDDDFRNEIANHLSGLGHSIVEASDGQAGIDLIYATEPDLVICDRMMPGRHGGETLQRLRQMRPSHDMKFVFLTALADRRDLLAVADLKPDGYLTKPLDLQQLEDVVNELCS